MTPSSLENSSEFDVKRSGNQRGGARINLVITLAAVSVMIFCGIRYIPVKVAAYEFRDALREETRFAAARGEDSSAKKRLLEKAEELEIPLKPKNLRVKRTRGQLVIQANYEQEIDFRVTKYTYRFSAEESAPLF